MNIPDGILVDSSLTSSNYFAESQVFRFLPAAHFIRKKNCGARLWGIRLDSPKCIVYTRCVRFFQLPIFNRKTFPAVGRQQSLEPVLPTGERSIMQTLPA